jgi:hypothetical protein
MIKISLEKLEKPIMKKFKIIINFYILFILNKNFMNKMIMKIKAPSKIRYLIDDAFSKKDIYNKVSN